jgi:hypothetical protein
MRLGRTAIITIVVLGFLLLLVGGRTIAGFLAELLWYRSLELDAVFWRQWKAALVVRGTAAVIVAAAVGGNLWIVTRSLSAIRLRRRYGNLEIAEQLPRSYLLGATSAIALVSAWWLSAGVADPLPILAALDPGTWNLPDPLFERDAAFYVFQLPVLRRLQTLRHCSPSGSPCWRSRRTFRPVRSWSCGAGQRFRRWPGDISPSSPPSCSCSSRPTCGWTATPSLSMGTGSPALSGSPTSPPGYP